MGIRGLTLFLSLAFFPIVHAAVNCSKTTLDLDVGMATDLSASKLQRLERMKLIYNDIRELRGLIANPKQMPASFYKRCYEIKNKAFSQHARNAHQNLSDRADFHALLGDYLFLMGKKSDSLGSYDRAATQDPRNADYKLKAFELFQGIEADRIRALPTKSERVRATEEFKLKIITRLNAILETQGVPPRVRSQTYVYKALALATDDRFAEAEQSWLSALKEMPSNTTALAQLSKFYLTKLKRPDKAVPHLRRLSQEKPDKENFINWIQAAYESKDHHEVLSASNMALKKNPSEEEFKAYKAWALIHFERYDEAKKLSANFESSLPKNEIAREARAKLKSIGAADLADSSPGQAISLLKEAIALFPDSEEFRVQLANVIVSHAKSRNFSPKDTIKKDFDYAISNMARVLIKKELSSHVAELGTTLYAFSSNPARGRGLCDKLSKDRLNTADHIINCAYIYKASKHDSKAQALLDKGLQDPKYKSQRERMLRAMGDIGI
ncbi:hypothetical protein GW915_09790 [bacterium]|nr:hypothetical protein [bacterium]